MIELTTDQREALEKLWFIYGNYGPKCTKGNHGYIQGFIEYNEDRKQFYLEGIQNMKDKGLSEDHIQKAAITQECIDEVDKIFGK